MFAFERNEQLGITVLRDKDLNKALMFDLCLECKDQRFQNLLGVLLADFQNTAAKQRLHIAKYKKTLEQILLNLIRCYQMDPDYFLIFPQDNGHYASDRYNPLQITRQLSVKLKDWLLGEKYLKRANGRWNMAGTGLIFRTRPTTKLKTMFANHQVDQFLISSHPRAEVIFYKDVKKSKGKPARYINYQKCSSEANKSRPVIKKYNELMNRTVISYHGKRLPASYFCIYRVFNNRDWQQGGRYYGQFSQMSKSPTKPWQIDRTKILINGNSTIEYDFSKLHPSMLYNKVGKLLVGDPYLPIGHSLSYRDFNKAVFNIIINCSSKKVVPGAAKKEASDASKYSGLNITDAYITMLIADLESTHTDIKQYFYSGEGLRLQYQDSLVATKVIDHFVNQDIPILPFHDSFIVESKYASGLKSLMQSSFKQVMGFSITVK